jgi:hypothetical protein
VVTARLPRPPPAFLKGFLADSCFAADLIMSLLSAMPIALKHRRRAAKDHLRTWPRLSANPQTLALDTIGWTRCRRIRNRGASGLASGGAGQPEFGHQPLHGAAGHRGALAVERQPQSLRTCRGGSSAGFEKHLRIRQAVRSNLCVTGHHGTSNTERTHHENQNDRGAFDCDRSSAAPGCRRECLWRWWEHPRQLRLCDPVGNIACTIYADGSGADCEIRDHTWVAPAATHGPYGRACDFDFGGLEIYVSQDKAANLGCYEGVSKFDRPSSQKLDYGHTNSRGAMTCESEPSGVTCTNTETGHFFRISRESYELG